MEPCHLCPPGKRVVQYCNKNHQTNCGDCPPRTFSSASNNDTTCIRCSDCKRKEILVSNCTSFSDTVCRCPEGFRYDKQNPCIKCLEGEILVQNICQKLPNTPNTPTIASNKNEIIIGIVVAAVLFFIGFMLLCFYWLTRRRKKKEKSLLNNHAGNNPDLLEQSKLVDINLRNNDYHSQPCPHIVYSPSQDQLLNEKISRNIPYEFLCELEKELEMPEQWQKLAAKLDFSYSSICNLKKATCPINALFDNLVAEQKKTYKDLCNALELINKRCMALKVVTFLN
ncbi:tumor necrosis factor receptor superfamily member 16 isoform X2 [Hydra vulgaris]|uniref:tumor necrosis factor receptor superfamily member 16 isoform X2 n=1 Tax=Hydra vulgaris TaxID=6087 RepID=UPI001F5EFE9B|nr:tumor necrosis factor receptor superfamily member 16 isoform X1 [Hydra vulgaris]